ncbi:hypothetical protein F8388_023504 [Cannabis sativa]|uniref:No apical meristem-associated C-terminal domain-containing protein n=1 Tax=Cannabis sativa TaxID=3483 RepID=A0A7J6GLP8_CANSA|nr:hypothetical protein F8388_023504 [Cannabis sativa]
MIQSSHKEIYSHIAWLNTSKNGVVGTDQNSVNFWGRITNYFNTHYKDDQLESNVDTSKDGVVGTNQISVNFWGRIANYFNTHYKDGQRRIGKQCKDHCNKMNQKLVDYWRLLKDEPKWNVMYQSEGVKRAKVSRLGTYTSSSNVDINDHKVREERPIGQKAAKRKGKGKGKQDEQLATFYDINQWKANVLEKLVAVQEKKVMAKYMDYLFLGTSNMTP